MSNEVILISLVVGLANYLFRYIPLRLGNSRYNGPPKRNRTAMLLDSIGIASICALLVVSTTPEVLRHHEKFIPTLIGFAVLAVVFYKTQSIIISTLTSAFCFGLAFKLLTS